MQNFARATSGDFPVREISCARDEVDWAAIFARIHAGDDAGVEALYAHISRFLPRLLRRILSLQDAEDCFHDVFLALLSAIRAGRIRQPLAFVGYAYVVGRRRARRIKCPEVPFDPFLVDRTYADVKPNPEVLLAELERGRLMDRALALLRPDHREILRRFYCSDEPKESICDAMALSDTQFRLLKSRGKAELTILVRELGKPRIAHKKAS